MGYLNPPSKAEIDRCHKGIDKILDDTIEEFRRYEQMIQMRAKLMNSLQSKMVNSGNRQNQQT